MSNRAVLSNICIALFAQNIYLRENSEGIDWANIINAIGIIIVAYFTYNQASSSYGVYNGQWDDDTTMLWDNKGVVLIDK